MYPYIILADETEICHSHIIEKDGKKEVEVHFERPCEDGFATARCSLPSYVWKIKEGFTDAEIQYFEQFMQHNAHLLFKYAESGGINIA